MRPAAIQYESGEPAGVAFPEARSVAVSVLVPARDEAGNIDECLRTCGWAEQVVVVDSDSRDATAQLARALGAEVVRFDYAAQPGGWPKKKNWALGNVHWRHAWVFILDADERVTPELAWEIAGIVGLVGSAQAGPPAAGVVGYHVNRRLRFMGRWIRHCGYYPSWNLRLFRHELGRYERIGNLGDTGSGDNEVHEHVVLRGRADYLRGELLHEAYPDIATWIEKHNRYSTWEAMAMEAGRAGQIADDGPAASRRRLRRFADRLPLRPTLRFLYGYVLKGGFLDGYPGLVLCRLMAWYEFASIIKFRERDRLREARCALDAQPSERAATVRERSGVITDTGEDHFLTVAARSETSEAGGAERANAPASSRTVPRSYSRREQAARLAWAVVESTLFRFSFRTWHPWRAALLRLFGAKLGRRCRVARTVRVECPWNLTLGDGCVIGDRAILYCVGPITLGEHVTVSQLAHLCAGTHDHTRRDMPLLAAPITVGPHAWLAADTFVGPGVAIGPRAVLGARASAFSDLPADMIAIGNPARAVKPRG